MNHTDYRIYTAGPITREHYGAVSPTTGCTNDHTHKQLMTQWYGLTPLTGHHWRNGAKCPHHAANKQCRDPDCYGSTSTLWDHARAWRDTDHTKVITLEPWGNPFTSTPEYQKLRNELDPLNVHITYEGRSPYGASYILFLKTQTTPLQGINPRLGGRLGWAVHGVVAK